MYFYVTILRQLLEAMLQNNRKSKTGKKKIKDQDKNIGKQSGEASDDGNGRPTVILSISTADLRNNPPQVEQHRGLKKCACVCVRARAHAGDGE